MPFIQQIIKSAVARFVLYAVIALTIVLVAKHYVKKITSSPAALTIEQNDSIDITPIQIRSIENIGEWEFLTINDEEMLDTVRTGFFSDDQLVRIYYGTLRLGINMKDVKEGWIQANAEKDSIVCTLPPIRLLDNNFIDEARTRSFFEEGKWTGADRQALYDRAYAQMKKRCLTPANIRIAQRNARQQFRDMFKAMGFPNARVEFEEK